MESHRLVLGVIVAGIILGALLLGKPSITGFVPTETYSQQLDIDVFESQRFVLSSVDNSVLHLSALGVSGRVDGNGLVNVYLSDGSAKWLVFSNRKREGSSMSQITGLAVLKIESGQKLDRIESLPAGYSVVSGPFQNTCLETCVLPDDLLQKSMLYLDVIVEPGTSVHISELYFSVPGE